MQTPIELPSTDLICRSATSTSDAVDLNRPLVFGSEVEMFRVRSPSRCRGLSDPVQPWPRLLGHRLDHKS